MNDISPRDSQPQSVVEHGGLAFDVSVRSLISLSGPDALDLLHRISTNDLSKLAVGASIQTILANEKGRIIDVLSVVRITETELLLASCADIGELLLAWIQKFIIMENAEANLATLSYRQLLIRLNNSQLINDLATLRSTNYWIIIERLGSGTWLRCITRLGKSLESEILDRFGIVLGSVRELETLRIGDVIPVHPFELNDRVNPLEVNLQHLISFTKGCYVGQEVIARLDTYEKVQRRLVGVYLSDIPISLPAPILLNGVEVGSVSSAVRLSREVLGMAFVKTLGAQESESLGLVGSSITARIRSKRH